eukprot:gb/GECG01015547.1/.p1 GENE.gb/GECG01015547.1/~~gb/GECG01015547.1/.p1  ORF type:complete len:659 (+),score=98.24 gb/GECG01015547.1/:1-1977(+)
MVEHKKRTTRNRGRGEVEYGEQPSYAKEIGNIFSQSLQNALHRETERKRRTRKIAPFMTTTPTGRLFDYESLTLSELARLGIPASMASKYAPADKPGSSRPPHQKTKKKKKKKGRKGISRESSSTGGEKSANYISIPSVGTGISRPTTEESQQQQRTATRTSKVQNLATQCLSKLDEQRTREDKDMATFHQQLYHNAPPVEYSSPFKDNLDSQFRRRVQSIDRYSTKMRRNSCPPREKALVGIDTADTGRPASLPRRRKGSSAAASLGGEQATSRRHSIHSLGGHTRRSSWSSETPYSYSASHHVRVHTPFLQDRQQAQQPQSGFEAQNRRRRSSEQEAQLASMQESIARFDRDDTSSSSSEFSAENAGGASNQEWERLLETYRQCRSHIGYSNGEKQEDKEKGDTEHEPAEQMRAMQNIEYDSPPQGFSKIRNRRHSSGFRKEKNEDPGDEGGTERDVKAWGIPGAAELERMLRITMYQNDKIEDISSLLSHEERSSGSRRGNMGSTKAASPDGNFISSSFMLSQHSSGTALRDRLRKLSSSLDSLEDTCSALQYAVDKHSLETNQVAQGLSTEGVSRRHDNMSELLSVGSSSKSGTFRQSEMKGNVASARFPFASSGKVGSHEDEEAHLARLSYSISSSLSPLKHQSRRRTSESAD